MQLLPARPQLQQVIAQLSPVWQLTQLSSLLGVMGALSLINLLQTN